jgi:uncharacterized protein YlzI (FlbEa/FlbD family)
MKFITLTGNGGRRVLINPMMITTLQEEEEADPPLKTKVYTMGDDRRYVKETIEEILELIKKSENTTTVTWKTGTTPHI